MGRLRAAKDDVLGDIAQIQQISNQALDEAMAIIKDEVDRVLNELGRVVRGGDGELVPAVAGGVSPNRMETEPPVTGGEPLRMQSQGNSSGGGRTPNNITPKQQQALDSLGQNTVTKIKSHLTPQEITEFVDELGVARVKELADKFGGDVMKHYGHAFFKTYQGVTQNTISHLLKNDGIVKGQIKGCHDAGIFYNELVTKGVGAITNKTPHPTNPNIIRYDYSLYKKNKDGSFVTPKQLKNKVEAKTVIKGLISNQNHWKEIGNEALDNAIKQKSFPVSDGKVIGTASDGTVMEAWYRGGSIHTIYPQF